ncbi:MAG: ABC transporter permease [Acidimicrobiales bacterium]
MTIKGLLAHKLRLALTSLAIVLGVTFISGSFVLTDTLHSLFDGLVGNVYQKIDFQVRGVAQFPTSEAANAVRNPLPESLLATVRHVPGVGGAFGEVSGYAQFLSHQGTPIASGGSPTIGLDFDTDQQISELRLVQGKPPTGPDDVVMDAGTAGKYHFAVGQTVRVLSAVLAPRSFTISGIARFGNVNNLAGVTFAAWALPTAQQEVGEVGQLDDINVVAAQGADKDAVQAAIARVLPKGAEVVTGQTVVNEQESSINQALSFFSTALLVFAFISLFVGAFTIFNTFSITVGQRTRELALLRVVGASRRQVFRSVLGEAAIVGTVSSAVGVGLGVLAALGLEALLRGFGITLPTGPLVFEPRTVVVGLAVGIGVTVISAVSPARRAVRIPPVAAITDRQGGNEVPARRRAVRGGAVFGVGAVLLAVGLSVPIAALVGLGALAIFVGTSMVAPALARPLASAIGRPVARVAGMPGRLGRENSMRSPRRTAQTASALMVGIALVSAMSVFGASISASATSSVDGALKANLIVTGTNSGPGSFTRSLADELATLPGVNASLIAYGGQFEVRQSVESLKGVTTQGLSQTVNLHLISGNIGSLNQGELLMDSSTAKSDHVSVGDKVPVKFALTGASTMRIGGIFKANALIGSYLVGQDFYLAHYTQPLPGAVLLKTNAGNVAQSVENTVERILKPYQTVQVQTKSQFEKSQISGINALLGLVYALLALAVFIALIGIVNTLMLSVFERTREIGLLRAVGMKRRQVRAMVRSEAVIISVFGAVIGIVVGTGLGLALVSSLKLTNSSVPVRSLVVFLVLSALLGLVAATWPARRAARLDVLAAIATQ